MRRPTFRASGEEADARAGLLVASGGLALLCLPQAGSLPALSPALALMVLAAALSWAAANVAARRMPGAGGLGLVVWSSLFSPLPLAALSMAFEGPKAVADAFAGIGLTTVGALVYLALVSTLAGYGIWNALIIRHGATKVAPFSLLVPIFSLSSSSIVLGERLGLIDALAAGLVLLGLLVHVFGPASRAAASPGARLRRPGPSAPPPGASTP